MGEESEYNEFLLEKISAIFCKKEAQAFIEANTNQRTITIRANQLKVSTNDLVKLLKKRRILAEPLDWCKEGLVVYKSESPLGATPEYLAGLYMIQGASSFLPVLNMEIEENLKIYDLCCSPGGKTTHIASLMKGTGVLYANDINKDRIYSVVSNLHRMGLSSNVIITNMDALNVNLGKGDRVLLDAPCSGTGIISKDPSVKTSKVAKEIQSLSSLQKKLIQHAFDLLKVNGILVYSTCSILTEENEEVVDFLLRNNKNAKVLDLDVDLGKPGFSSFRGKTYHQTIDKSRRIYPHVQNMDGFYYCKIKKCY